MAGSESSAAQGQRDPVDLARGYAVPSAPGHINVLACAVLALHEENERLRRELATREPNQYVMNRRAER